MLFSKLALAGMLPAALAGKTVTVIDTVYECPCSLTTTTTLAPSTTPSTSATSTSSSAVSTSTAPGSCYAIGAQCSDQTATHGCCPGSACNFGLPVPICQAEDTTSSTTAAPVTTTSTKTTSSAATTTTAAGTCYPLGADCSDQTVDHGCCKGTTCDFGLLNPICVSEDATTTSAPAAPTTTVAPTTSSTTTSPASAATCIALNAACSDQTATFGCCPGTACNFGLDTPICVTES